jgi:PilZ domain
MRVKVTRRFLVTFHNSRISNHLTPAGLVLSLPRLMCMGVPAVKQGSRRAKEAMMGAQRNERSAVRVPLHVAATAVCPQLGQQDTSALIRDVTPEGVFFFAQFVPQIGSEVSLSFHSRPAASSPLIHCTGKVVRVERFSSGAAGIALKLHEYRLQEEAC